MRKYVFQPCQTTYHSIMSSLVNQGKVSENLDVFDVMRRDGWYANEITRCIIVYGLYTKSYTDQNCVLCFKQDLRSRA